MRKKQTNKQTTKKKKTTPMRVFFDLTLYIGLLWKLESKSYWSTDSSVFPFILTENQHLTIGTEFIVFFNIFIGKLLKITDPLHARIWQIIRLQSHNQPSKIVADVNNVLWNSVASTRFDSFVISRCLCTSYHRSGFGVWVTREDQTSC